MFGVCVRKGQRDSGIEKKREETTQREARAEHVAQHEYALRSHIERCAKALNRFDTKEFVRTLRPSIGRLSRVEMIGLAEDGRKNRGNHIVLFILPCGPCADVVRVLQLMRVLQLHPCHDES